MSTNAVEYMGPFTQRSANEGDVEQAMPVAGTVSNLFVRLNAAPGTGGDAATDSFTFTVRKNQTGTSITCTITGTTDTTCSDTTNSETFAQGDLISIETTPTNSPGGRQVRWTLKFVAN